jgi:hypothetical protein
VRGASRLWMATTSQLYGHASSQACYLVGVRDCGMFGSVRGRPGAVMIGALFTAGVHK